MSPEERRERTLATLRHPSSECAFCGQQGDEVSPLGFYGPFDVTAHEFCWGQHETDRARDPA